MNIDELITWEKSVHNKVKEIRQYFESLENIESLVRNPVTKEVSKKIEEAKKAQQFFEKLGE